MKTYTFPENFWWGSAASGPQTEGRVSDDGKGENIWDHWYELEPEKFFDQVGPEKTSQVYTKYKEDVQLMKETGHNTFRTSIQWSRLIPEGTGEINQKAVSFYRYATTTARKRRVVIKRNGRRLCFLCSSVL